MARFRVAVAAAGLFLFAGAAAYGAPPSAPSVEEVKDHGVSLGEMRFSPDGTHLLFAEKDNRRHSQGLWLSPLRDLMVVDVRTGVTQRIGPDDGVDPVFEGCASWSPDDRGVAFIRRHGDDPVMAFADLATGRTVQFAPPVRSWCNSWVGERLVWSTSAGGPPAPGNLGAAADALVHRWREAWSADSPQVTTHSSNPLFPSSRVETGGVAVADPKTGAAVVVGRGTYDISISPSPDGRRFAAIRRAEPLVGALAQIDGRRGEVQIYELTAAGARLVQSAPDFDAGKDSLAWSADGRRLLVGGRVIGARDASLLVMVPGDGGRQVLEPPVGGNLLSDDPGSALTIWPLGWVGGTPAALVQLASSAQAPSDAHSQYGAAAPRTLHLFSFPDGAPPVDLTAFLRQSVRRFVAGPQDDALLVADGALWSVSPRSPPRRISASDLRIVGLADAQGSFGGNEITALGGGRVGVRLRRDDGERLAILSLQSGKAVWTGPPGVQVAYTPDLTVIARVERHGWSSRLQVEGTLTRQIAETNPEWRERPTGTVKRFTYTLDGRRLNGWIVLPPGYTSGALPAIVRIYGGQVLGEAPPPLALASASLDLGNGQLWAGQGYAVIYPSTPIGHGADSDIPDTLARATVAAVDAAAASGWVDPARVGIMGHSFGGYSTAAVLSVRSDRFRAGIADSGAYDFASAWGVRPQFEFLVDDTDHPFTFETRALTEEAQGGFFAPPWATPEAYRRTSPFDRVASIRSPLMLWVGDLDMGETSLSQSERMYAALRRTGNPTVLVRYWGQRHVQADPWALADQWGRAQAWFGAYVRDAHPRQAEIPGSVLGASQRQ